MDAVEAQHQIKQMINFILNEAKDKAEEIESGAIEDFNIEKMTIFENKKDEVRSKIMKKINALRLEKIRLKNKKLKEMNDKILRYQCDVLNDITACALEKLRELTKDREQYKKIITMLAVSGCVVLNTDFVLVKCRSSDRSVVELCLGDIKKEYERILQSKLKIQKAINIEIDNKNSLPDDLLGVVLTTHDGTIECDVTLNNRLNRCFKEIIPEFKPVLFPPLTIRQRG